MRPDAALAIEKAGWRAYLARLGECAGVSIHSIETLKQAILIRMDAFGRMWMRGQRPRL